MGKEASLSVSATVSKNGLTGSLSFNGTFDLTGTEFISRVQTLSTSESQIDLGGIDQNQCVILGNPAFQSDGVTPNTATLTVGLNTPITQTVSVIPPGKGIVLIGASLTLYGKGSAGTPDLLILAFEN